MGREKRSKFANDAKTTAELASSLAQKSNYRQTNAGDGTESVNMIAGFEDNAIASDLYSCTIAGGGSIGRENVIGGNAANVGTANPNLPTTTGTNARYAVIGGGYDNVNNALAGVLTGFHCKIEQAATHGTISGGSFHEINGGDYNTVAGGTINAIESGSNNTISGGRNNTIDNPAKEGSTISGGFNNIVNGVSSVVSGGSGNKAQADNSTVSGGYNNTASGVGSVIGGGGANTASGLNSEVLGGTSNTASGSNSLVNGGFSNIASGNYSNINGGANHKSIGDYSAVSGGRYNEAQKQFSNVGGGFTNIANGDYSAILGGQNNTSNGNHSSVLGGQGNVADGLHSSAHGLDAKARTNGQIAHAFGKIAVTGDAQESRFVLRNQTTTATATVIGLNGTAHPQMADDSSWLFKYLIIAKDVNNNSEAKAWEVTGLAMNNTGASASLIGTPTKTVIAASTNASTWDITVGTGTDSLFIQGTGEVGKTINWVAMLQTVEVIA
jgi:hypothetical protein